MSPKKKSTIEVGHVKNLNNFEKFIIYCGTLQPRYNPIKDRIKVVDMQTHHQKAKQVHALVNLTDKELVKAVNFRQEKMAGIKKKATRLHGALVAATDDEKIVEDFLTHNRKIQGKLSIPKTKEDQPGQELLRAVSSSQQSIDQLIDNFEEAVQILELVPEYIPNETELTIPALKVYIDEMKSANINVTLKTNEYSDALDLRDKIFYEHKFGIVDTVDAAKKYIISVYTFDSPEYRRVEAIHFRNLSRYK